MTGHPTCPRCKLPCLRLVDNGKACDWCSTSNPHLGKPFDARKWRTIVDALTERLRQVTAA